MGLFTYTMAGGGFILMGSWEALTSTNPNHNSIPPSPLSTIHPPQQDSSSKTKTNPSSSSSLTFLFFSVLSSLFLLNSLVSFFDALNSNDKMGSALQLQVLAIASLFLLYSLTGFVRKDTSGIENHYYDLLLVPIAVCLFATMMEVKSPKSNYPKLARGVGLILQGTWFVQMGISFYSNLIAHGCALHEKSRGNYTIRCKGHPEYHRARAVATLQFNCHLALMVLLVVGIYSVVVRKHGVPGDFVQYRPLSAEMQQIENAQFSLDSDDDVDEEIKEVESMGKQNVGMLEMGANGHGSH
ncbi:hypothetical protein CMV_030214 [Castanea mollissima]|uniref:Uncharacterized protein n=1 Tax=Castanea mollissima TaxID=60419 RepID=A0A8J4Q564_9ROSI|nr:hypothetical protein CMV_030214 [Castanea mollissima]